MQLELAQKILKLAEEYGYMEEDLELRADHRGSAGIVGVNLGAVCQMVIENADFFLDDDGDPLFQSIGMLKQDSMGLSTIVY